MDPNCILDYIDEKPEEIQPLLRQIRQAILAVIPSAQERIAWQMPTFWEAHNIIHFAAFKKHIGLYPGPAAVLHFEEALKPYKTSKGAIQFQYNEPIPFELIQDITTWCYTTGNHP